MKIAPRGHYRKLLSNPHTRIAFADQPIIGCTIVDNTSTIAELEQSGDEYAQYYIEGLKSGRMVAIRENAQPITRFDSQHPYFTS